jgi:hypothetical protein
MSAGFLMPLRFKKCVVKLPCHGTKGQKVQTCLGWVQGSVSSSWQWLERPRRQPTILFILGKYLGRRERSVLVGARAWVCECVTTVRKRHCKHFFKYHCVQVSEVTGRDVVPNSLCLATATSRRTPSFCRYPLGAVLGRPTGVNSFTSGAFPWTNVVSVTAVASTEQIRTDPSAA